MIVYIDTLIAINLLVNYLLLLLTVKLCSIPFKRWRMACGALIGSVYALAMLIPHLSILVSLIGKVLFGVIMTAIAFAGLPAKRFARVCIVFFGVSFAFGGCVLAIGMLSGSGNIGYGIPYLSIDFKIILLAGGICYAILAIIFRRAAKHTPKEKTELTICFFGRKVHIPALIDTGNTLTDPMSGRMVIIAEWDSLKPLFAAELRLMINNSLLKSPVENYEKIIAAVPEYSSKFRLIPYKTVGEPCGFLLAFQPDSVEQVNGKKQKLLVAISPTRLSDGGEYAALVGA